MFVERPILGWGPVVFLYELGSRVGRLTRDPHNGFVWFLLEVEVVGAIFFYRGFSAMRPRSLEIANGPRGILPLALLVQLATMNFSAVTSTARRGGCSWQSRWRRRQSARSGNWPYRPRVHVPSGEAAKAQ